VLGEKLQQHEQETRGGDYSIFLPSITTTDDSTTAAAAAAAAAADMIVWKQGGLILDLRSPIERKEELAQQWMNHPQTTTAFGGSTQILYANDLKSIIPTTTTTSSCVLNINQRYVVRLDVLNPKLFMQYADDAWLKEQKSSQLVMWYKLFDGQRLHELRMDELNRRGLSGLNEAILEIGKEPLCLALQFITAYREQLQQQKQCEDNKKVVIHCVQGKDRYVLGKGGG
jgi:hypothetical protein